MLAREVLPKLVEGKTGDDEVRVWVAGCATGEEAYSIAMILREALTDTDDPPRLQLFASDIDEDALQYARTGRYPAVIERDVSSERLDRYFLKEMVLPSAQLGARDVRIRVSQRAARPAVLADASDLVPQPHDLSQQQGPAAAPARAALCLATGRLPLPRAVGERRARQTV